MFETIVEDKVARNDVAPRASARFVSLSLSPPSWGIPIFSSFTRAALEIGFKRSFVARGEGEGEMLRGKSLRLFGDRVGKSGNLPSTEERRLRLVPPVSSQEQIELLILDGVLGWRLGGQGRRNRRQQGVGRRRRRRGQRLRERCRRERRRGCRGDRWRIILSRRSKRAVEHRQRPCDHVVL